MITIAVVCGAGTAASARISARVRERISARGRRARVVQALVMDLLSPAFRADLVVSTVALPDLAGVPKVSGMPLLLGTDEEATFAQIDRLLDRIAAEREPARADAVEDSPAPLPKETT